MCSSRTTSVCTDNLVIKCSLGRSAAISDLIGSKVGVHFDATVSGRVITLRREEQRTQSSASVRQPPVRATRLASLLRERSLDHHFNGARIASFSV